MRVNLEWLGEMLRMDLDPQRLAERLTIGGLEVDSMQPADAGAGGTPAAEDVILDLDLTPNRGDCFSVLGVAREAAALHGVRMETPVFPAVPAHVDDVFPVAVEAEEACPRFAGRIVRNLAPGRTSPAWLETRLRRAGLHAIHPVVDVTNYVMLELGQPLHGYDLHKLCRRITVRFAGAGETLTLLDGNQVTPDPDVLVIADDSGAIGLAGIMGGQGTAVELSTRDVFLESAFFSPAAVIGRARRFGLHTEASLRFERGVDPAQQVRAIERATALIVDIVGGEPGPVVERVAADHLPARDAITLRSDRLHAVLGTSLDAGDVEKNLRRLQMDVTRVPGGWSVAPPPFRFDLDIEEDLVEEVGRMVGYDRIPAAAERGVRHLGSAPETRLTDERIADLLSGRGYAEVVTYSLVDEAWAAAVNPGADLVRVTNPLSREMSTMRRSLWPGLLATAGQNLSRQRTRVRLFEIGVQFARGEEGIGESRVLAGLAIGPHRPEHWEGGGRGVDFFDVKADLEAVLALTGRGGEVEFRPAEHPALARGQSARLLLGGAAAGWLGVLHPRLQKRLEWKQPAILFAVQLDRAAIAEVPKFREYPKFPSLRRDIAAVLDEEISADQILECVRQATGEWLRSVTIFDVYQGKGIDSGRKSVALGLILQDTSRTFTDADADSVVASATRLLERALGATIRE